MIKVDLQGKSFGKTQILGPVAFTLEAGETLAVLGPSGVGKSTLLRIVAGLDPKFSGKVMRPDRVAMVFQEPTLLPWRSVAANLTLTTGIDADHAERVLSEVGLTGRGGDFPGQLSLGQQRRVGLARALAAEPELLVLDEPFASLDDATREEMLTLTAKLIGARQIATMLVTHAADEAERLATRILHLTGSPATLSGI